MGKIRNAQTTKPCEQGVERIIYMVELGLDKSMILKIYALRSNEGWENFDKLRINFRER